MGAFYKDNKSPELMLFFRLLDSNACIFFYWFWYKTCFEVMFSKFLKFKMWIIILCIMKHDRDFFR